MERPADEKENDWMTKVVLFLHVWCGGKELIGCQWQIVQKQLFSRFVLRQVLKLNSTPFSLIPDDSTVLQVSLYGFDVGGGDFWGKTDGTAKGFCTRAQRAKQNKSRRAGVPGFLWRSLILVQYNTGSIMIGHYFYRDERRNTKNDFTLQNHTAETNKGINLT